MVRFKVRWVMAEIFSDDAKSKRSVTNTAEILKAIRTSAEESFGEFGIGKLSRCLKVEYYNPALDVFLVQCGAPHVQLLMASLFFVTSIGNRSVSLRVLHSSGTLKKSKKALKDHLYDWLVEGTRQLLPQLCDPVTGGSSLLAPLKAIQARRNRAEQQLKGLREVVLNEQEVIDNIGEYKE